MMTILHSLTFRRSKKVWRHLVSSYQILCIVAGNRRYSSHFICYPVWSPAMWIGASFAAIYHLPRCENVGTTLCIKRRRCNAIFHDFCTRCYCSTLKTNNPFFWGHICFSKCALLSQQSIRGTKKNEWDTPRRAAFCLQAHKTWLLFCPSQVLIVGFCIVIEAKLSKAFSGFLTEGRERESLLSCS